MLLLAASVGAASPRRLPPARVALRVRGGQVAEAGDPRLHLAGKLFPALRRTVLTSEKCGLALTKVLDAAAFADFAVIASIGLAATPILKFLRAVAHARFPALGPWESSYMSIGARGLRRLADDLGHLVFAEDVERGKAGAEAAAMFALMLECPVDVVRRHQALGHQDITQVHRFPLVPRR